MRRARPFVLAAGVATSALAMAAVYVLVNKADVNIMGWYDAIGIAVARGGDGRLWAVEEFGRHF